MPYNTSIHVDIDVGLDLDIDLDIDIHPASQPAKGYRFLVVI